MRPLNAIDAIAPAFTRAHELLFKPFKLGRSWKLAATSYLAWGGSFFIPYPLLLLLIPRFLKGSGIAPAWVILIALVPSLLYLLVFYCCVRLQLVDFEMVVTTAKMIAPMWRRYRAKVWPWLVVKAVASMAGMALVAPLVIYQIIGFMRIASAMPKGNEPADPQAVFRMMASLFGFYGSFLLLFFAPKVLGTLLDDFALPFFVLEDVGVLSAIKRGANVFAADPLQCLGYLGMKLILGLAGYMMQSIAVQICMIPLLLIFVLVGVVGGMIFGHGEAAKVLGVVGLVVLGLCAFVLVMYASMLAFGYLLLMLDSYAIYFMAGRYPLLGNLLEPGPGAPFAPPPVFPSAEEQKDDDGGPPMPMNPAVA